MRENSNEYFSFRKKKFPRVFPLVSSFEIWKILFYERETIIHFSLYIHVAWQFALRANRCSSTTLWPRYARFNSPNLSIRELCTCAVRCSLNLPCLFRLRDPRPSVFLPPRNRHRVEFKMAGGVFTFIVDKEGRFRYFCGLCCE